MMFGDAELAAMLRHHLQKRHRVIDAINTDYAENMTRYLYYHLHWLALELANHEREYVTTFAHEHLGLEPPLLPVIQQPEKVETGAVLACFKAHTETARRSEGLSAYFYRRYLGLLTALLQGWNTTSEASRISVGPGSILQSCVMSEPDFSRALTQLAPASWRQLFPQDILDHPDLPHIRPGLLPTDTDRRLYTYARLPEPNGTRCDVAAANTLNRLERLHGISVFESLPAEAWLELVHRFLTVRLEEGDSLIWKDEVNHDVYIVIGGELAVFISEDGRGQCVGRVRPGELIGEIAFLSRETRQATVRATKPSECLVLRDLDLRILGFKYPDIFMTMGKVLAQRLTRMNEAVRLSWSSASIDQRGREANKPAEELP
jgi:CRP-like cAMP-binding protein